MQSHTLTCAIVLAASFGHISHAADVQPSKIEIGGPRKVVATISEQQAFLDVTVRMIPVRCFDAALNATLSRDKARSYAVMAVGQYLSTKAKGTVTMTAHGVEVVDSHTEDKRLVLTLRFPREAIVIQHAATDAKTKGNRDEGTIRLPQEADVLLTVKDDYLATLRELSNALNAELPPLPKEKSEADAFYRAVADCEETADRRFDEFRSDVKVEKLLLTIEQEGILSSVETRRKEFLNRLQQQVQRFDAADGTHK